MSRFLSFKMLKYRGAAEAGQIDHDLPCRGCGYNLRGLNYGRACPECGQIVEVTATGGEVLLSGDLAQRLRRQYGLAVAAFCVAVAIIARAALFLVSPFWWGDEPAQVYVIVGTVNGLLWIGAVWLLTPPSLDEVRPRLRRHRLAIRALALLWPAAYALLIVRFFANVSRQDEELLYVAGLAGRFAAGIGVLLLVYLLRRIAEEAELERAERRLNAVLWLLWLPTAVAHLFPATMAWFTLILLGVVLFFWCWLMSLLLLGLLELHGYLRWVRLHAADAAHHTERIDAVRRELDQEVEAAIRPPPEPKGDLPLE